MTSSPVFPEPVFPLSTTPAAAARDLSPAAQTAREDVANAVTMLDEVLRTARQMDFRTFNRAVHLLRTALTKTAT